ncbi:MAG: helix-turn-helix transcriptional regulator [Chitinophagaceae bacterium]
MASNHARQTILERAKKNRTQAELADKISVSGQAINSIGTGKFVPSTVLALKMAKVFGTTVEVIFQLEKPIEKEYFVNCNDAKLKKSS